MTKIGHDETVTINREIIANHLNVSIFTRILSSRVLMRLVKKVNEARKKDGTDYTPEEVMYKIETNDLVLYGAIKYLYNEQTQDEKSSGSTREHNGRGFNAYDAEFMSSLAEWLLADPNHKLSAKQKEVARKKLKRYKTQLTMLANRG